MGTEEARTVLQGLHLPSLDAAASAAEYWKAGVRWRGDTRNDDCEPNDDNGDGYSAHAGRDRQGVPLRRHALPRGALVKTALAKPSW
jgi:hypothetical protein